MWINKRRWSEVIARLERLERARGTRDARAVAGPEREEKMGEMLRRHFRLLRRGAVGLGYAAEYRVAAREGGGYSAALEITPEGGSMGTASIGSYSTATSGSAERMPETERQAGREMPPASSGGSMESET